jgi:hypothetical protein
MSWNIFNMLSGIAERISHASYFPRGDPWLVVAWRVEGGMGVGVGGGVGRPLIGYASFAE